jgi:hypothetical protein
MKAGIRDAIKKQTASLPGNPALWAGRFTSGASSDLIGLDIFGGF